MRSRKTLIKEIYGLEDLNHALAVDINIKDDQFNKLIRENQLLKEEIKMLKIHNTQLVNELIENEKDSYTPKEPIPTLEESNINQQKEISTLKEIIKKLLD